MFNNIHHIDKELFSRISFDDEDAFRQIFHAYNRSLYPFIVALVKSDAEAKEIIQEVFMNLWLNRRLLHLVDNPGGWLHTMAANSAYSHLRKEARYARRQLKARSFFDDTSADEYFKFENRETLELVSEAIQRLPVRRREVFQLSRIEGYSRKEVAERLNISENTVRNQLACAVSFVQNYLRKKGSLLLAAFLILGFTGK